VFRQPRKTSSCLFPCLFEWCQMKQSNKQISQINSYCIHENWKKLKCGYVIVSGFYPYTCGHSLRPVKNRRSFDKVVDQNFPLLFTGQTTPLTKLSLEGKEAQNRRENKSEMGGNFSPKLGGGSCVRF